MERLNAIYLHLLEEVNLDFFRYLYPMINWDNRLIIIRGQKGVGKTTSRVLSQTRHRFSMRLSIILGLLHILLLTLLTI